MQQLGSSPLTWGKLQAAKALGWPERLIPAHVGKTRPSSDSSPHSRAHPRSRGENRTSGSRRASVSGSSPLTWGKLTQAVQLLPTPGLIPAHVGKTPLPQPRAGTSRAHPRSRGENSTSHPVRSVLVGSSPLTRGKCRFIGIASIKWGLIPAHAGKMGGVVSRSRMRWAHPRSRGENRRRLARRLSPMGSSPLTRGKFPRAASAFARYGLIPAHAGKIPAQ